MGAWCCCTSYISIVSPLINYDLSHIQGSLAQWKYMYLVAGATTILWAIVIFFFMPPDPIRAKGFTDRERYVAVARMKSNNVGVRNTHTSKNCACVGRYAGSAVLARLRNVLLAHDR
jgi:hypothetical protein